MNVTPELDSEFRAAALREGLVDVRYDVVETPIGELLIAATDRGLARIHFGADGQEEVLARIFGSRVLRSPIDEVRRELDEYFEGRRHDFDLPLDLRVVPFNAEVLGELALVPVRYDDDVRRPGGEGRPAARGACDRHGDEPESDPDRPAVPPRDRRERLAHRLRRRAGPEAAAAAARGCNPRMTRVVVVGGGFAGLLAVRGLRKADVEVTLVDRQNFHLFQPLAYQVATGALSAVEIASPLSSSHWADRMRANKRRCRRTNAGCDSFGRNPATGTQCSRRRFGRTGMVSGFARFGGERKRSARRAAEPRSNGQPSVTFTLTGEGGQRFYNFTSAHVGDSLAVVLDNKVQEVANIEEPIRDQGSISGGSMNEQQAKDLSHDPAHGRPAGRHQVSGKAHGGTVAGSGFDSRRRAAAVVGMLAVLIFMLVYYRGAGINADLALILNLMILLGFMGYFGARADAAGDRRRDPDHWYGRGFECADLRAHSRRTARRQDAAGGSGSGLCHAWVTIVDTHVTTIVSAAILFIFGTGPVKGFATTLVFGLLANLFTAVFVSRVIFDLGLNRKERGEALSI